MSKKQKTYHCSAKKRIFANNMSREQVSGVLKTYLMNQAQQVSFSIAA